MKGLNAVCSTLIVVTMLASCKADMICPAYQSYFLLDSTVQHNRFTYFAEDSFPRRDLFNSSKNKEGLMVYEEYRERWLDHKTVPMEVIYPQPSDSTLFAGDVMMYAETDVVDSAALDSARMAAQTFQYNVDQKYYNWYFRDKLVWADELNKDKAKVEESTNVPKQNNRTKSDEADTTSHKKFSLKGIFGSNKDRSKESKKGEDKQEDSNLDTDQAPTETPENNDGGLEDF
ncbi:MAG: hypothetical protein KDC58_09710 [Cyclobacteriaceae bacterium]|nr:hypothetical protein [Cyclobacteriaceae bacterium]